MNTPSQGLRHFCGRAEIAGLSWFTKGEQQNWLSNREPCWKVGASSCHRRVEMLGTKMVAVPAVALNLKTDRGRHIQKPTIPAELNWHDI